MKIITAKTSKEALAIDGVKPGLYAVYKNDGRGGWEGWYEDAVTGARITAQVTPGRLDINEVLDACERETEARLIQAGYPNVIDPFTFLKKRGWRFISGKGWKKTIA